jgi:hypothetical protein
MCTMIARAAGIISKANGPTSNCYLFKSALAAVFDLHDNLCMQQWNWIHFPAPCLFLHFQSSGAIACSNRPSSLRRSVDGNDCDLNSYQAPLQIVVLPPRENFMGSEVSPWLPDDLMADRCI